MVEEKFETSVGMSRDWDAKKAGKEVARKTIEKLNAPPDFFLLFSTIHYEKHGGFDNFLKGVWEVLPENTPLIGGTIPGFITPQGCFTRGASALAVSYKEMDVALGFGLNTKKNPQKAAKTCSKMINDKLKNSSFTNKYLIEIVSGGKIPQFAGMGRRKVIKSGMTSKMATRLSNFSLNVLQYGVGREEEILDGLVNELPDYTIIGGSSIDDNSMVDNYQFYNDKIYSNSLVALGVSTNQRIVLNTTYGLTTTDKKLKITKKGEDSRVIQEINNKPALEGFLKTLNWPYNFIDERLYRKTFFTPLGFWKDDILFPNVIGLFLGNNINVGFKIESDELSLLSASGKSLLQAVDDNLKEHNKVTHVGFIISCSARLETLGNNIFKVKEKLSDFFGNTPYLLVYVGGEDTYSQNKGKRHINESFNVLTLS